VDAGFWAARARTTCRDRTRLRRLAGKMGILGSVNEGRLTAGHMNVYYAFKMCGFHSPDGLNGSGNLSESQLAG
jgi:hypothetical protein